MKLYLIVAKGKQKGLPIPIKVDLFLMGSDAICQLRSKLPGVAAQHCALVTRDNKVFVKDLEGDKTFVNDELMPPGEEWPIHAGDRLTVGPLEFMFQFHERALSQKDAEEWALKSLDREAARKGSDQEAFSEEEDPESGLLRAPPPPENAASAAGQLLDKLTAQRGVVKGRLRVTDSGNIKILRFNDTFLVEEAEIAFVKKELLQNLEARSGPKRYLLDFKNVARMSSTAGEMLKEVRRRIQTLGGSLALCRVRPELQLILETIGFIPDIKHFTSKEDALTGRW
jgi:anti-anti-sigma regulatory factor